MTEWELDNPPCTGLCAVAFGVLYPQRGTYGKRKEWREVEILKKKQLKCYLYTRVSTSMQVDGYSLDAQRDKLRKYAAYEDMIVAGEYSDEGFFRQEHSRAAGVSTDAE